MPVIWASLKRLSAIDGRSLTAMKFHLNASDLFLVFLSTYLAQLYSSLISMTFEYYHFYIWTGDLEPYFQTKLLNVLADSVERIGSCLTKSIPNERIRTVNLYGNSREDCKKDFSFITYIQWAVCLSVLQRCSLRESCLNTN